MAEGAEGRGRSGIMDAFTKYDDWFGGTKESNIGKGKAIDTEVADAMKGKGSFDLSWNLMKMAEKGQVPTRDMFQSDAEYRYVLKEYNEIRNYIENVGTPEFEKELQEQKINSQQRKKEGLGWKELLLRTIGIIDIRRT